MSYLFRIAADDRRALFEARARPAPVRCRRLQSAPDER
ncbi:MAG: hypothetical protein AW07_00981 [Candidatus Accumulibacter sp. SK-11]|nr:MAG: hypothetical protein AW07_00981 [Candidatus Accumulibacter sp. SK-11]